MEGLPKFYNYVAIFTYEDDGIHITYPDLPGCVSFGADEDEAARKAEEVLQLHMFGIEEDGEPIPKPSSLRELKKGLAENEVLVKVNAFMPVIREKLNKRFIKKTVSIPYWVNAEGERYGVNFSQLLQNAVIATVSQNKKYL